MPVCLSVPQYTIGSPPTSSFLFSQMPTSPPEIVNTTVPVTFYGRAVFTEKDKTFTLEDISIAATVPDTEDWWTLNREPD
jgi:hypothetical protein